MTTRKSIVSFGQEAYFTTSRMQTAIVHNSGIAILKLQTVPSCFFKSFCAQLMKTHLYYFALIFN